MRYLHRDTGVAVTVRDGKPMGSQWVPADHAGTPADDYTRMTVAQLKDAIRARNDAGESISLTGNKSELVAALTEG